MIEAILFDAGDTLIEYIKSEPLEGTKALLQVANNPNQVTAEEIQAYAMEMGQVFNEARESTSVEYSMRCFQSFLHEMHEISFDIEPIQVENIFNQKASVGKVMDGVLIFLDELENRGIRKAILSNSSFSEEAIREELRQYGIDDKRFEFVISTSEYGFRKRDHKILGSIQLRHSLTDELAKHGRHIGYEIRPSERRKGYAVQQLKLVLEEARQMDLTKVMVSCNRENMGSARTILRCGGILEDEVINRTFIEQIYWINLA